MPIQFHCKGCQGWIEVDDEHSGGKAICPFCQAVNGVPGEPRKPQQARPAQEPGAGPTGRAPWGQDPHPDMPGEPSRPGEPEVRGNKPPEQQQRELTGYERQEGGRYRFDGGRVGPSPPPGNRLTRIGMFGLAGAILSVVLMIVPATIGVRHLPKATLQRFSEMQDLPPDQRQEFMRQAGEQFAKVLEERPWIGRVLSLGMLLWIVSVVANFSVVFGAGMHRRSYGWAGLIVNSILLFLCLCSGIMQHFMGS